MVKISGEVMNIDGMALAKYLESTGYDIRRIVIERNGNVLPKREYSETILNDGDVLEIVSFVGGG